MFHDPIAEKRFADLQKQYGFNTLIETGTHLGHGALNASKYCETVITCEINPGFIQQSVVFWSQNGYVFSQHPERIVMAKDGRGIFSYYGNSPEILDTILPDISDPVVCFYLDAHWGAYWPLLDELATIARQRRSKPSVIIIHDFKVPGKDFGFDNHGGKDLDLDYVRAGLNAINPRFKLEYNTEAEGNKRGILYALPPL